MKELKPGDTVLITQRDGKRLMLFVYENGLGIKAEMVGTKLMIDRVSSFSANAAAVDS